MKLFVVCRDVLWVCVRVCTCVQVMLILFELMGRRAVLDLVAAALTERKVMCACVCLCMLVCVCVFMCVLCTFVCVGAGVWL